MKNIFKITLILTLVAMVAAGCQQKTSSKKKSSSSSGSGLTDNTDGTNTTPDSGSISGCDGIQRTGFETRCYYKNINRITLSGAGNPNQTGASATIIGPVLWSSSSNLPSGYDLNSFTTDSNFYIRIKPFLSTTNEKSVAGRFCGNAGTGAISNFSRMKVFFMLTNSSNPIMDYVEVEAKVNQYSGKVLIEVPKGPGIKNLQVVGVLTDHRCKRPSPPGGCSDNSYWGDIPLVVSSNPNTPTGCGSFKIEYSTDSTYELP